MNKKGFWILIVSIHCICLFKQLFWNTTLLQDTKEYLYAADNLIESHQLYCWDIHGKFNPDYLTKRPLLFPTILAFFKILSFGNFKIFLFVTLITQNIISLINIRLMLKFVFYFTGKINYRYALILLLLAPAQIIYANIIMSEIWLQFVILMLANYFLFYRYNFNWHILATLLCVAGIALKPVFLFWAFIFPVLLIYTNRKNLNYKLITLSLIPALFVMLTIQWNGRRTGAYQYSSISTINLLHYNTYTLLIHETGIKQADSIVDDITFKAEQLKSYKQQQEYKDKSSKVIISNNLGTYFYLHLRGALLCLIDPGRFDITQFFDLPHKQNLVYETSKKNNKLELIKSFINPLGLLLIFILLCNIIKFVIGIRFIVSKQIKPYNKFLLLLFPIYIVLLTGPIGSSRFAMPFIPIYLAIILIALGKQKNEITA